MNYVINRLKGDSVGKNRKTLSLCSRRTLKWPEICIILLLSNLRVRVMKTIRDFYKFWGGVLAKSVRVYPYGFFYFLAHLKNFLKDFSNELICFEF